jgi:hypothetical protein
MQAADWLPFDCCILRAAWQVRSAAAVLICTTIVAKLHAQSLMESIMHPMQHLAVWCLPECHDGGHAGVARATGVIVVIMRVPGWVGGWALATRQAAASGSRRPAGAWRIVSESNWLACLRATHRLRHACWDQQGQGRAASQSSSLLRAGRAWQQEGATCCSCRA